MDGIALNTKAHLLRKNQTKHHKPQINKTMQIKYGIQIILSEQHLAFDDTDTDEAGEAEVSDARWRAFWEDRIEKQNKQRYNTLPLNISPKKIIYSSIPRTTQP